MTASTFPVAARQIDEILSRVSFDDRGLVPAVVTRHDTREVLMLAWLNAESLRMTLTEGRVVYWSRSRSELWRKGDTSGNTQRLVSFALDCDADTILLGVDQHGPACHTGTRTCFDGDDLALEFPAHDVA
ncbi:MULTISPECIES: phosphoribosyl-AMP cyclohydrolase [unclassified Pseudoclavibacter]|uniref:phosphoribosyl-AMP cyclohydrolase n=1 Tax=unclassified Pseudoclavibacter TaxID=2615177 RepID=UPI000CE8DB39|nr:MULTISPECIES: phosphoribosyl-AMP cyclohydrolase [unclassified Pseudoclavibacter]PPF40447.1 phosphoribosyl-AMP cyclohydrolase [Pseudoclavibacter sp. AY1H1]PPF75841.1 phosphoribosyl-AMP cyclohydrolase [Pseudoclavibacter sp. Z016]